MKNHLFLLILLSFFAVSSYSFDYKDSYQLNLQPKVAKKTKGFDPSRITFGGNFGASFGSVTYVDISPLVGYRITDRWIAGVGISYIYYRQKYTFSSGATQLYQTSLYGGRLFTQFNILPNVFLHGELEALNFDYYDFLTATNGRAWYTTPMIGAGYSQPIGARSSFRVMALYAFGTDNPKSPYYQNPLIFRVGFFL